MSTEQSRALDAQIAEQVFGYTLDYEFEELHGAPCVKEICDQYDEWGVLPHYSTEMGDAWLVVEHLRARGYRLSLYDQLFGGRYCAMFVGPKSAARVSDTAPEAICRAALAAMDAA